MKHLLIGLIMLLPLSAIAAEDREKVDPKIVEAGMNDAWTAICVGEKSVGFNWENNQWKQVNFKPAQYMAQKIPLSDSQKDGMNSCVSEFRELPLGEHNFNSGRSKGCYNIRKIGEKFMDFLTSQCREDWRVIAGVTTISAVFCPKDNFNFSLDSGYFHHSVITDSLEAKSDYKDSMFVEVGKCSKVK